MSPAGPQLTPEVLLRELRSNLFPERGAEDVIHTYALLDGASVPDLLDHLYANPRPEFICLYRGELEPDMAEVAPYLVRLEPEARFTEWLLTEGWGRHWGVFARTGMDLKAVRKHLRRFLMVLTPESKRVYFRYYDPRVLPHFLPTCDAFQLQRVFGPVATYLCEGDNPAEIARFQFGGEKLETETIELGTESSESKAKSPSATVRRPDPLVRRGPQDLYMGIRKDQMDALAAPRLAQLPRKIMRYLHERCPKAVRTMTDEELESFLGSAIDRASGHGIEIEWDLCRYCWLEALHGPAFAEEIGWVRTILESKDLTPTERVDMLEHYQRNYHEPMFNP